MKSYKLFLVATLALLASQFAWAEPADSTGPGRLRGNSTRAEAGTLGNSTPTLKTVLLPTVASYFTPDASTVNNSGGPIIVTVVLTVGGNNGCSIQTGTGWQSGGMISTGNSTASMTIANGDRWTAGCNNWYVLQVQAYSPAATFDNVGLNGYKKQTVEYVNTYTNSDCTIYGQAQTTYTNLLGQVIGISLNQTPTVLDVDYTCWYNLNPGIGGI